MRTISPIVYDAGSLLMSNQMPTILLVHGAWHGAWCWERVVPLLKTLGRAVRTVELPSVGAEPGAPVNLSSDAAAVRSAIDEVAGPVLLCGHSYGGMVISQAASRRSRVVKLVYLCAFVPEAGESLADVGGGQLAPWIQVLEGGLTLPDIALVADLFFADCDIDTQTAAIGRLRPQAAAAFAEPVAHPAWKDVPSTYVICADDRAMPAELQRGVFARRAGEVLEIASSHSPFLSQPQALASLLANLM